MYAGMDSEDDTIEAMEESKYCMVCVCVCVYVCVCVHVFECVCVHVHVCVCSEYYWVGAMCAQ